MQRKSLTPDLAVMSQIDLQEVQELAAAGFRSIISNRPDGESPDQPEWIEIKGAATRQGMEARYIPVVASDISEQDVDQFREALRILPKPIAAFCRTGTRSTLLWALANESCLSVEERIRVAADQGYDLAPFRSRLETADETAARD